MADRWRWYRDPRISRAAYPRVLPCRWCGTPADWIAGWCSGAFRGRLRWAHRALCGQHAVEWCLAVAIALPAELDGGTTIIGPRGAA